MKRQHLRPRHAAQDVDRGLSYSRVLGVVVDVIQQQ